MVVPNLDSLTRINGPGLGAVCSTACLQQNPFVNVQQRFEVKLGRILILKAKLLMMRPLEGDLLVSLLVTSEGFSGFASLGQVK